MAALEVAFPTLLLATHRYAPLSFLLTFVIASCSLYVDKRIHTSLSGFIADPFFVHDIVKELPVALQKRVKFSPSLTRSACGCVSMAGVTVEMQTVTFLKNDRFNCLVVRVKCESEWDAISIFLRSRL